MLRARMTPLSLVRARPRLFIAIGIGVLSALILPVRLRPLTHALLAWDIGCLTMLILSAELFTRERRSTMAEDAARQQEGEWTVFWITVVAVMASFAAVLNEFAVSKDAPPGRRLLHVGLVAGTLLLSWLVTHTVFALRYAHEYYECSGDPSTIDKGLEFPGEDAPDYWDFFYFSLVLGMTFQVSDVQITSRKLRRLAAAHGLLSFLFNTVIVALSVNIGAGLL